MTETLKKGAAELHTELSDVTLERFSKYAAFLQEKNKVMNLTAITQDSEIGTLHFLDSLSVLKAADFENKTVIDIGSGAGFPGMPIKLAVDSVRLTLLDAQQKRVDFLKELCAELGLTDVACLHGRAEEAAEPGAPLRDSFDVAVSRAVARLNVLCELCMPFVKPGGLFIAMKSVDSEEEINEAKTAIKKLGGRILRVEDYTIPCTDVVHRLAIIEKVEPTPKGYPRRFAKIKKSPL